MAGSPAYVGRFAPSPTGPLHFGSLIAGLASFLDARSAGGKWLLRIEDIDPPREMDGATDSILRTLESHGLTWDGSVLRQSERSDAYLAALERLGKVQRLFPCICTRSVLGPGGSCGGRCDPSPEQASTLRFRLAPSRPFQDFILGPQSFDKDRKDMVLRRRDGLFAYTLAVVVDDAWQGISHVLRGEDLLAETPVQLDLFDALDLPAPQYGHAPVLRNETGTKLSKQTGAPALRDQDAVANLRLALSYLNQPVPADDIDSAEELLTAATHSWSREQVTRIDDRNLVYRTTPSP